MGDKSTGQGSGGTVVGGTAVLLFLLSGCVNINMQVGSDDQDADIGQASVRGQLRSEASASNRTEAGVRVATQDQQSDVDQSTMEAMPPKRRLPLGMPQDGTPPFTLPPFEMDR